MDFSFNLNFRWEEVGGDKLMKFPRVEAPNGLHIRVSNLTNEFMYINKYIAAAADQRKTNMRWCMITC